MTHPFLQAFAAEACERGIATLRYQFPFIETGAKRPDPPALAHATVRAAVAVASRLAPNLPLVAGGKSFGGRMTSQAQALSPLSRVKGLVFLGFPLHAAGRPSQTRAEHLSGVAIPMLFLQGTRDALAHLDQLEPVILGLGQRATLKLFRRCRSHLPPAAPQLEDRCRRAARNGGYPGKLDGTAQLKIVAKFM
jgi:predicted alpha/beta-hydrolase family hydrolase